MSAIFGNYSQTLALRKLACAVTGVYVLIAAPASFAQRAGAPGTVIDYDYSQPAIVYDDSQAETVQSCSKPISPFIPDEDISKRVKRQITRDMREFLDETGKYIACVRAAFVVGKANDVPDSQLLGLVDENNATVEAIDELAAVYEERIGPIKNLLPRAQPRFGAPVPPPYGDLPGPAPTFRDNGLPNYNQWTLGWPVPGGGTVPIMPDSNNGY
jgi:hypothetical protein